MEALYASLRFDGVEVSRRLKPFWRLRRAAQHKGAPAKQVAAVSGEVASGPGRVATALGKADAKLQSLVCRFGVGSEEARARQAADQFR